MKRRAANVEEHPKGSGLYRVRARVGEKLVTIASKLSETMANETADAYEEIRDAGALVHGITLGQFGDGFLDRREKLGGRSTQQDESRWRTLVKADLVGDIALASLKRGDLVAWRDRLLRRLSAQTVKNALNLVRVALAEALDRELVKENVARDVKVPRKFSATQEEDLAGVLAPPEQLALLQAVPADRKPLVAVALLTGLRWSELSWLRREDIRDDEILVRRSVGGGPTKSGKPRRVPLLEPAKTALSVQLASLPARCHWVFPGADGEPRKHRPSDWQEWVRAAGIERPVRWHDLRHTCATSLLAGWWSADGARWTLDEVCSMLGHSSVTVTERYARKLDETLSLAVARVKFPGGNRITPKLAESFGGESFPKPWVGSSNLLGSAKENSQVTDGVAGFPGTSREHRLALLAALDPEAARPGLAVCRALARVLAGDQAGAVEILAAEAKAAGGGA